MMTRIPVTMLRAVLLSLAVLLLPPSASAAAAGDGCLKGHGEFAEDMIHRLRQTQASGQAAPGSDTAIASLNAWLRVNERLAKATGFASRILICDLPGLNAFVTVRGEPVRVHRDTLDILAADDEMIAVVLAHEYAHLVLQHQAERRAAAAAIGARAGQVYRDVARTAGAGDALEAAKREFMLNLMAFSREQELSADDHGIALMAKSGYRPDAFTRLGQMIINRSGNRDTTPFASHPGFAERLIKSDDRVNDESFDQYAARLTRESGIRATAGLLEQWLAKMPESGNALYYRSLLLRERRQAKALETLEEAFIVSKPTLKQKDEDIRDAWVWLCTSLYQQGYRLESANCAATFFKGDRQLWDAYQKAAFPGGVWVGNGGSGGDPNLSFVRTGDGRKLITNDASVARSHGVDPAKPTPAWKPIRYRAACGGTGQPACGSAAASR